MAQRRVYWGETHDNVYQRGYQTPPLDEYMRFASSFLDFTALAYYTSIMKYFESKKEGAKGVEQKLEFWKTPEDTEAQWADVCRATREFNAPGAFVTFPGYEWHGDGVWGDHNVVYREEGDPVHRVDTIEELYAKLRGRPAIAIPHHTAYQTGHRAPDWSKCDPDISPFTEVYSNHGSSENDANPIGLAKNTGMGPGMTGGTWQDALDRGLRLGAIASTDGAGVMPAAYDQGLMGCVADELTREGLWRAFLARRVYGVTGDRIELDFSLGDAVMGDVIETAGPRRLRVAVRGWDAIDRIEILRDGRVIHTYCHQGTWDPPAPGQPARYRTRVEVGWGPRETKLNLPDRKWDGRLEVAGGRMLDWQPCWRSFGQSAPTLDGETARFAAVSHQGATHAKMRNAIAFEYEADPGAAMRLEVNGQSDEGTADEFARRSNIFSYRDEAVAYLREYFGVDPATNEREDPFYHESWKCKRHLAVPESAYTAGVEIEDDAPLTGESNYRVRVEQVNGQRAWSSPIWVRPTR